MGSTTPPSAGASPRLRVLMFMEHLPEGDDAQITGGIEARCFYVARWLRQSHDVILFTDNTGGARSTHASARSLPRRIWYLLRSVGRGLRTDFDVIDSTSAIVHPFAWLLGALRRKPVVLWYPDLLIGSWRGGDFGRIGFLGELAERIILRLPVARYIAISESTRSKLLRHGVATDRVHVVPCGYEPSVVDEVMATRPARRPGHVAAVNRLVPYKRVDVLIDAAAVLAPRHPDLRVKVIGAGPERDRLVARARARGVGDRFEFTGLVESHLDVLRAVAEAEVFVSCSAIEGFGIVVVEAMSFGTPFVVTDIPAFREVTAGGTGGALFPAGDVTALAAAVEAFLDDTEGRRTAGEEGRAHAARYTWASVAEQTADCYADVVAERRRRLTRRR